MRNQSVASCTLLGASFSLSFAGNWLEQDTTQKKNDRKIVNQTDGSSLEDSTAGGRRSGEDKLRAKFFSRD